MNNVNNLDDKELNDNTFSEIELDNVINVSQFDRDNLRTLFKNASILKQNIKKNGKLDLLKGKLLDYILTSQVHAHMVHFM